MARFALLFALVAALVALAWASTPNRATGVAFLRETNPTQFLIIGQVYFYQNSEDGDVRVEIFAFGNENFLRRNRDYALQVHQYGDISARDATFIGDHLQFSATQVHGCPEDGDNNRHNGDLGNFFSDDHHQLVDGKTVDLITTYNSSRSIIGRSVVLKTRPDTCDPGFVGIPLAFGTIGLAGFAPNKVGLRVDEDEWLVAYLTGSGACYDCHGTVWATQEGPNNIRIIGKAYLPAKAPDAHQFAITQYGDITVKTGDLMGGIWKDDDGQSHKFPGQLGGLPGDLGNNQFFTEYDDDDSNPYTWSWLNVSISGRLSDIAGRGVQVYESYDRGAACQPTGGGGRLFGFGVFGVADPDNSPPQSFPPKIEAVGALDDRFCAGGFLGVGLTTVFGLLVALFLVL